MEGSLMALRMDAYEAVKEKKVKLEATPANSFKKMDLGLANLTDNEIDLDLSRTAFIPAKDSDAQRIGITRVFGEEVGAYVVTLPPHYEGVIECESRCLDYHRPAPANGLDYFVMLTPLPPLIVEMLRRGVSQEDIWADIEGAPDLKDTWNGMDPRGQQIMEDSIPISAISEIQGEWHSPEYSYAFEIVGNRGFLTLLNRPETQAIGDEVFRIHSIEGNRFKGDHGFTDQSWRSIEGEIVSSQEMILRGGGLQWTMYKR
jgi:hypothetical protein